jgi:cold shock CspA family protein
MCSARGLPPVEIAAGVVSQYFPHRGYGFIDSGGPRIFFHISDLGLPFTPHIGQAVTCHVEQNARGLIGKWVKPQ